ncbi:alpha/beta hydrolase family protein [Mucilaginibacter calamicampi]|uniref:Alpha/beta hydrolase family protein n=1 Tax=Mucilaginibacter calamicampi TaxID=1302352 RepID=A0ABW2YY72_9SPHI
MIRSRRLLLLFYLLIAFSGCKDKKADGIPVSDFFTSAEKTNFKISPNGEYVAYLKRYNDKQNLFIKKLEDGSEEQATSYTDGNVRGDYLWTFDNQILFSIENFSAKGPHQIFKLDVQTLKTSVLFKSEPKVRTWILNTNRLTPDVLSITMNKRTMNTADSAQSDVYNLNLKTGEAKLYLTNPGNITEWFVEADGSIRLAKATEGADESIFYRSGEGAPFKLIIKNNFRNSVRPIIFSGVKNYFYASSNVGRDKMAIVEINAEDGKEQRVVYASDKADMQRVDFTRSKHRIESVAWEEDKPKKHFFDKGLGKVYQDVSAQLAGSEINLSSRDTAEQKFIVTASRDRSRGAVYLYERKQNKLSKLNDNPKPNPEDMCAMEPISYHATDGLVINGYVTYPQGNDRTNLPVIVMPHDGPFEQRDQWGYKAETQFFASRGYAVLQVNYRGSSGYGKEFSNSGFKEQGGKIQQDILDGVNWLIQNKIANPAKVAIVGRRFGGFSALYGVSFFPHKYACAVAIDAPINAFTYVKELPSFLKPIMQRRYEMFGDPEKDAERLKAISPVFNHSKVKSPVIIFQAGMDQSLNTSEMSHYISNLRRRNVPVEYNSSNKERRSGSSDSSRTQMYQKIEKFLHDNMLAKP